MSTATAPTGAAAPRGPRRMTAPGVQARKRRSPSATSPTTADGTPRPQPERLVMVTAYDAPSAKVAHRAGADMILVGDSLAMVVLGYEDTLQVTTEDMAHHTAAVQRGLQASEAAGCTKTRPLIVGDLPWMSYHVSEAEAVRNAALLLRAGAGAVKLEGGRKRLPMIKAILDAEIPVMGHIGLTPQSVNAMGGFKVQGKQLSAAQELLADAQALEEAGCFGIVLEGIPDALARVITESISIPTIGIGAGADCDGQVLVWHDILGIEDRIVPKFVRKYAQLGNDMEQAIAAYCDDVRTGAFPSAEETYAATPELAAALTEYSTNPKVKTAMPGTQLPASAGAPPTSGDRKKTQAELLSEADDMLIALYGGNS